jgi:integrase
MMPIRNAARINAIRNPRLPSHGGTGGPRDMLRHSCGYKLANDGVDTRTIQSYLGHKSIQHTVRYTELAPTRFKSLFRD